MFRILGCELAQGFEIAPALPSADWADGYAGWNARRSRGFPATAHPSGT